MEVGRGLRSRVEGAFLPVGVGSEPGSDLERPSGRYARLFAGMRTEPASRDPRRGRAVPGKVCWRLAAPQPISKRIPWTYKSLAALWEKSFQPHTRSHQTDSSKKLCLGRAFCK